MKPNAVFMDLDRKYTRKGAILKGARLKAGMTIQELAAQTRLPAEILERAEKEPIHFMPGSWKAIADALGIDVNVFLEDGVC